MLTGLDLVLEDTGLGLEENCLGLGIGLEDYWPWPWPRRYWPWPWP